MRKNPCESEAWMGIDQGSTATKVLLLSPEGEILFSFRKPVSTRESAGGVYQDPKEILTSVMAGISGAVSFSRERNITVRGAGLATQRSSFLFFDRRGDPLTPLVSWRDTSGAGRIPSLFARREEIKEISGLPLTPYYSAMKLVKHIPTRRSSLLFGTVNTFLIFALTGGKVFATDPANAQRTLLFDVSRLGYSDELLRIFSVPRNVRIPEVRDTVGHFGDIRVKGTVIPIISSTGDQQAAFFGSSGWERGRGLINLGTGGFLLIPLAKAPRRTGDLILTLSHVVRGKSSYLLEGTVNAVSDSLRYFEGLLGKRLSEKEFEKRAYPVVVFGHHGTGAPLWDLPFPAAVSGVGEGTDTQALLASSLFGSLCYFRLIDEAMVNIGLGVDSYVVSGGLSSIGGVSRFLRDLLGKGLYRSMAKELTGAGAALMGMVLGSGKAFPRKRGGFRAVRGRCPVDAQTYFSEWERLYRFARGREK